MAPKLKTFEVVRTPKLKDSRNEYVKRGEICHLTKELAEHYHKLGYIRVSMDGLYDEEPGDNPDGTDEGAGGTASGGEPGGAQSDTGSGTDDEGTSGEDAETDVGEDTPETGRGRLAHHRRKRASG